MAPPYTDIEARRRYSREHYRKHKAQRLAQAKAYREKHKAQIMAYRASPEGMEYHRKKAREYYWRNREREIVRSREYRLAHPDKVQEYRKRNYAHIAAVRKAWFQANRERVNAQQRKYIASSATAQAYHKMRRKWAWVELDERCRTDAECYAKIRAKDRANYARRRVKQGKAYTPNVARRYPDTMCKGGKD